MRRGFLFPTSTRRVSYNPFKSYVKGALLTPRRQTCLPRVREEQRQQVLPPHFHSSR